MRHISTVIILGLFIGNCSSSDNRDGGGNGLNQSTPALDESLQIAANFGDLNAAINAIEAGANVNAISADSDKTAVERAAYLGRYDMQGSSLKGERPSIDNYTKIFDYLIKAGANLNRVKETNRIPGSVWPPLLTLLCSSERPENEQAQVVYIAHLLISSGADVNLSGSEIGKNGAVERWVTPLICIARDDKKARLMDLLLTSGADVNLKTHLGENALMRAAYFGAVENIKRLLAAKAEVNAKNNAGETALAIALKENNREVVTILKRAGAKVK